MSVFVMNRETVLTGPRQALGIIGDVESIGAILFERDGGVVVGHATNGDAVLRMVLSVDEDTAENLAIFLYDVMYKESDDYVVRFSKFSKAHMKSFVSTIEETNPDLLVLDAVIRRGNKWISTLCTSEACCPEDGQDVYRNEQ